MCWDFQTSVITFVIGTVFNIWNIWHYKNSTITAISLLWEWVLLMQFFEAFAWKNQPKAGGACNSGNTFAAKGAYLANVTQPIMFALTMFALQSDKISSSSKIMAATIIFMYILWLLYAANIASEVTCLKPGDECGNLTYTWWQQFPGNAGAYLVALVLLIFIMVKPMKFALMQLAYISATFIGSAYFYSCGIGSVWCWFAAFAPLLVGPMWEASKA